jgi:hypothetical protein
MPAKPSIWYLPQPERDCIPPRDRNDRQVWPGYWIYHNRDDSISFGTEQRDYFGWLPAEITRAVPESVINTIASMVCHAHRRTQGSARLSQAIRSRADARAGLAALSDERLAENDSSSAATHIRRLKRDLLSARWMPLASPSQTIASRSFDLYGFYIVCSSNSSFSVRTGCHSPRSSERSLLSFTDTFDRKLIGLFLEKIVFKPLSPDTQREIALLALSEELTRFRERGFDLMVFDEAFEFLIRRGIQKTLCARPMRRTVQKFIGDAVRDAFKSGEQSSWRSHCFGSQ